MIKRTILGMIAMAFALCASAQVLVDDDENESINPIATHVYKNYVLSVGPKVGVNYSMASDPDGLDLGIGGNIGYSGGLAFNVRFGRPAGKPFGTERFGVELEALYSLRSLKNDYVDDIKFSNVEVPLLFQWYALPNLFIEVGPTFVANLSTSGETITDIQKSSVDVSSSSSVTTTTTTRNIKVVTEDLKNNDIMLTRGVGYKHKSGFTAGVRYNLGNSDLAGNFATKVSTVSVGIGWLFNVVK
jgi:hypothetical protein